MLSPEELEDIGEHAFSSTRYDEAERLYNDAIYQDWDSLWYFSPRVLWTSFEAK